MGKIRQGILGGFNGSVGTVVGSSWNGIAYMRGRPQSIRNPRTPAQMAQRRFFKEVQNLASQLSAEQQAFLFPLTPQGMTRRNALIKQFSEDHIIEADGKHVDLANIKTLGNAPTAALPEASVTADGDILTISWNGASDWRTAHADEYPTVFVANVTKKRVFLINSPVAFGAAGEWAFVVSLSAYGEATDTFSGFLLSTGSKIALVGYGTLAVATRPERDKERKS